MKLIDGHALADRLLSDAITDDQRRQAILIGKVIEEMPEAQPEPSDVARQIATILENECDMRIILKTQKHGMWLKVNNRDYCSECNYWGCTELKYCPNCGADMRGGAE